MIQRFTTGRSLCQSRLLHLCVVCAYDHPAWSPVFFVQLRPPLHVPSDRLPKTQHIFFSLEHLAPFSSRAFLSRSTQGTWKLPGRWGTPRPRRWSPRSLSKRWRLLRWRGSGASCPTHLACPRSGKAGMKAGRPRGERSPPPACFRWRWRGRGPRLLCWPLGVRNRGTVGSLSRKLLDPSFYRVLNKIARDAFSLARLCWFWEKGASPCTPREALFLSTWSRP